MSAARATSSDGPGSADVAGERVGEVVAEAVDGVGLDAEGLGQRDEVGRREVDPVGLLAAVALVEAQHPVAAVVDDERRSAAGPPARRSPARRRRTGSRRRRTPRRSGRRRPRRAPPGTRSRASPSPSGTGSGAARRARGAPPASSRGCTCRRRRRRPRARRARTPPGTRAPRDAPRAARSSARARGSRRRSAHGFGPGGARPRAQGARARVGLDDGVGAVVLARVGGVDVDATSRRGGGSRQFMVFMPSRSLPIATTTSAPSHSAPASGRCGGRPTASGWPAASAAGGVGGEDGRAEALGQRDDRVAARPARRRPPTPAASTIRRATSSAAATSGSSAPRDGADARRGRRRPRPLEASVGISDEDRAARGGRAPRAGAGDLAERLGGVEPRASPWSPARTSRAGRRPRAARRRPCRTACSAVGTSVAITTIGEREAHASPVAPSVLAAPGPVVTSATPTSPVARA